MSVTPIRGGGSPSEPMADPQAGTPEDILSERLRHAHAIVDLIHFSDRDSLDHDTLNNVLWVLDRYIIEAEEAAERLCGRPREGEPSRQDDPRGTAREPRATRRGFRFCGVTGHTLPTERRNIMVTHDQELLAQLAAQIAAGLIARTTGIEAPLNEPLVADTSVRIAKAILEGAQQP